MQHNQIMTQYFITIDCVSTRPFGIVSNWARQVLGFPRDWFCLELILATHPSFSSSAFIHLNADHSRRTVGAR